MELSMEPPDVLDPSDRPGSGGGAARRGGGSWPAGGPGAGSHWHPDALLRLVAQLQLATAPPVGAEPV